MRSASAVIGACLGFCLIAACNAPGDEAGGLPPQGAEPVVRDSAGIRIVENTAPRWGETPAWTVEREPAISIGVATGDPDYELVNVNAAIRLDDGRIVIADEPQVRFYDGAGRHLKSIGRRGAGPGEFYRAAGALCPRSDGAIAVADGQHRRFHIISTDGEFTATVGIHTDVLLGVIGCFGDGTWLASHGRSLRTPGSQLVRMSVEYRRIATDGAVSDLPVRFDSRWGWDEGWRTATYVIPLSGGGAGAARGDYFVFAPADANRLEIRAPDGALRTLIAGVTERRRTADSYDDYVAASLSTLDSGNEEAAGMVRVLRQGVNDLPRLEYLPAYQAVHVDARGFIWAERYYSVRILGDAPRGFIAGRHDIFDRNGVWLGTVTVPPGLDILEIGTDYVLARHRDELNVQYVRLHRIIGREP